MCSDINRDWGWGKGVRDLKIEVRGSVQELGGGGTVQIILGFAIFSLQLANSLFHFMIKVNQYLVINRYRTIGQMTLYLSEFYAHHWLKTILNAN